MRYATASSEGALFVSPLFTVRRDLIGSCGNRSHFSPDFTAGAPGAASSSESDSVASLEGSSERSRDWFEERTHTAKIVVSKRIAPPATVIQRSFSFHPAHSIAVPIDPIIVTGFTFFSVNVEGGPADAIESMWASLNGERLLPSSQLSDLLM